MCDMGKCKRNTVLTCLHIGANRQRADEEYDHH
jgi:hypothetical protein